MTNCRITDARDCPSTPHADRALRRAKHQIRRITLAVNPHDETIADALASAARRPPADRTAYLRRWMVAEGIA